MSAKRKTNGKAPVVRPMRIAYADVASRMLAALENAYGRLEDANDPRITIFKPADIADVRVQVLDPPPPAALVTLPKNTHSTLCTYYSPDTVTHHSRWHPVATFFHDRPGILPRDPERAQHDIPAAALAALSVAFGQMDLNRAYQHWAGLSVEQVEAVDVKPVAVEAATAWPTHSGSSVLFLNHNGIWWPCLRIQQPGRRAPDPPSWAEQHNYPKLSIS